MRDGAEELRFYGSERRPQEEILVEENAEEGS